MYFGEDGYENTCRRSKLGKKWPSPRWNLKVDDLVLVIDESASRGRWPKAVVEDVFSDRYRVVCQVNVRTPTTILRREIRKICLLEGASSL